MNEFPVRKPLPDGHVVTSVCILIGYSSKAPPEARQTFVCSFEEEEEECVMEVDVLEFKVPVQNNKTLFVWDIQPSHTQDQVYVRLLDVFSSFGPLYLLKVRLSSRQTPHFLSDSSRPLSHARCLELANHCLGFNGWTSDIITLKELTNEEEKERGEEDDEGGGRWRRLKFGCVLQLSFPHHGQTTRAAAVVEDSFTCSGEDGFTLHHSHSADAVIQRDLQ
ncbi:RAD52 motif-containing protein 1-like isoform X3 [Anarrhichthys ocellatus]|uniref:RAD52 motif-containing protein 1-like isoform X2 n=1 Tax=Anarrhichthys ocellatus TaxID=433405 RepID=UPI0012EE0D12|nr:RAD52 motif-containing protein 1-like isoform X2 [Anarrhichthys ocellatus]XP_031735852.1 RAD52 motif-containing protein 1-like isoform X3 [Anarrhichthys ocellatus]